MKIYVPMALAVLIVVSAWGRAVVPAALPPAVHADTETVTNVPFATALDVAGRRALPWARGRGRRHVCVRGRGRCPRTSRAGPRPSRCAIIPACACRPSAAPSWARARRSCASRSGRASRSRRWPRAARSTAAERARVPARRARTQQAVSLPRTLMRTLRREGRAPARPPRWRRRTSRGAGASSRRPRPDPWTSRRAP